MNFLCETDDNPQFSRCMEAIDCKVGFPKIYQRRRNISLQMNTFIVYQTWQNPSPDELRDESWRTQQSAGRLYAPDDPSPRECYQHGKVRYDPYLVTIWNQVSFRFYIERVHKSIYSSFVFLSELLWSMQNLERASTMRPWMCRLSWETSSTHRTSRFRICRDGSKGDW